MKKYGVIIARFQVPELHLGHVYLIKEVMKRHDFVLILLGVSSSVSTDKNPLSFSIRKEMVKQHFPSVEVEALYDIPHSDKLWSINIDHILSKYEGEPILYGSRDSFEKHYYGKHNIEFIEPIYERSGTDVRNELVDPIHNTNFRAGIIHHINTRFPIVYPTVDIACFMNSNILLGRKHNENLWRFPGGFVDVTDASYLDAAKREFREEVGNIEVSSWSCIGSTKINDPRYKGTKDGIMTTLYTCDYVFGQIIASDDLEFVQWWDMDHIREKYQEMIVPTHYPLIKMIMGENND